MTIDSPPRSGWDAAALMCTVALEHIDEIALGVTGRIREELSDYVVVPFEEHREWVTSLLRRRVEAFRDREAWTRADMEKIVELARQRARQGISVDALIFAYHVSDQELWRYFVAHPGDAAPALPEITSLMLESLQAMTTALASAHNAESRAQQGLRTSTAQRLLGRLSAGKVDAETRGLALFFGFDLEGGFASVAWRPNDRHAMTPELEPIVEGLGGALFAHAQFQSDYLILVQGAEADAIRVLLDRLSELGYVGVGSTRHGIDAASASIEQSRLALTSATDAHRVSVFADRWVLSCATSHAALIESEVSAAVAVANAHPSLSETIQQFAASDMSTARCARDYHLHANTVTYRLDRWQKLTGLNPRNFGDLGKSVVACVVASAPQLQGS